MARGLKPEDAFNKALYYTEGPGRGQNWISALVEQEREAQVTYTLVATPTANFEGNLTVDVAANVSADLAANGNTVAVQSVQAVDTKAPSVVISDDETGTANIAGGDVVYTFQFSEGVTDFTAADIDVVGGTKGLFTAVDADAAE
jgi:Bacterial Ig-like domain